MPELEAIEAVRDFLETGGDVLFAISGVTLVMWLLILERVFYFRWVLGRDVDNLCAQWRARQDKFSWAAHHIRRMMISEVELDIERGLIIIRALVALCPMLGLLGTVTGMIEVFDVMAISGSGNARGMAGGVSRATIPTMAGMVAALSGLIFSVQLDRYAKLQAKRAADRLEIHYYRNQNAEKTDA